jgi:aminoglycoside phosphotransferase (APT) family kinase protein
VTSQRTRPSGPNGPLFDAVVAAGLDATGSDAEPATDPEYRMQPEATVQLLASTLAELHSVAVPAGAQPVLGPVELVSAVRDGRLRGRERSDAYAHMSMDRLVEALAEAAPTVLMRCRSVVTHGGPTLDTLRCRDGRAVGLADWSRLAVGDPYRDLAVAATSVAVELGPVLVPVLLDAWVAAVPGEPPPDPLRLDFHALAAELLG